MSILPQIGWVELDPQEAADFGLEQPARWRWRMFRVEWMGFGMSFMAECLGVRK